MLTAVRSEEDRIADLEMGADGVVKAFRAREVVSRVQAVLRRTRDRLREAEPFRSFNDRSGAILPRVSTTPIDLSGEERGEVALRDLEHRVRFLRRKLENSGVGSIEILPGSRYRLAGHLRLG